MSPLNNISDLPLFSVVPSGILLFILLALLAVATVLKAFALWHAARNHQALWFVALLILNTLGILELIYLIAFRKDKQSYTAPAPAVAPPASTA